MNAVSFTKEFDACVGHRTPYPQVDSEVYKGVKITYHEMQGFNNPQKLYIAEIDGETTLSTKTLAEQKAQAHKYVDSLKK